MKWTTGKWRAVLLDFLERAGWSAGEAFFATLLAGGGTQPVANLPWKYALTLAVSAAVVSILLTIAQYLTRATNLSFWWDLAVRLGKTFVSSFLASVAAAGIFDVTKFGWGTAFNIAIVATIGALGKGLLARQPATTAVAPTQPAGGSTPVAVPDEENPSTLRTVTYDAAVRPEPTAPDPKAGTPASDPA